MAKTPSPDVTSPLEPEQVMQSLNDIQSAGLGSLSWLGTMWVETMSDISAEWLSFVADRVQQDVKTQHALMHAKSVGDIQHIQAKFLQRAMDDYARETGKMVEFCSKAMAEIHERAQKTSKEE